MIARRRKTIHALAVFAVVVGGCNQLPNLTFPDAEDSGSPSGMDASLPEVDAGLDGAVARDAENRDSAASGDGAIVGVDVIPSDDAADEAPTDQQDASSGALVHCGDAMVANCAGCGDGILRCQTPGFSYCVPDCTACSTGSIPCIHCPGTANKPRGVCLPVNPTTGVAACAATNLCACTSASDCLAIPGAAQTCEAPDSGKKKGCMACGGAGATSGLGCVPSSGEAGVCEIAPQTEPTCD